MRRSASLSSKAAPATLRRRQDFAAERPGVDLRLDATPRVQVVIGASAMRAISEETLGPQRRLRCRKRRMDVRHRCLSLG
jgi:hypothetical protein